MKNLNKKGFTLIELLAVIVVLAIIMVIATQQVNKTIRRSRANAFVESYQMLVKQVKTFIASDEDPTCGGTSQTTCLVYYDLSNDYSLSVTNNNNGGYNIILGVSDSGKFKNMDLTKDGSYNSNGSCQPTKIASNATSCEKSQIQGTVEY